MPLSSSSQFLFGSLEKNPSDFDRLILLEQLRPEENQNKVSLKLSCKSKNVVKDILEASQPSLFHIHKWIFEIEEDHARIYSFFESQKTKNAILSNGNSDSNSNSNSDGVFLEKFNLWKNSVLKGSGSVIREYKKGVGIKLMDTMLEAVEWKEKLSTEDRAIASRFEGWAILEDIEKNQAWLEKMRTYGTKKVSDVFKSSLVEWTPWFLKMEAARQATGLGVQGPIATQANLFPDASCDLTKKDMIQGSSFAENIKPRLLGYKRCP